MTNTLVTNVRNLMDALERWESQIKAALAHGQHTHTFDDVVGMILANRIMFFAFEDCFTVMEVVTYPQFSVFHCFLAGGEMEGVLAAQGKMDEVGAKLGCKYLSIAGRKGWERQLSQRGWKHISTAMFRPIGDTDEWWKGREAENNSGIAPCH